MGVGVRMVGAAGVLAALLTAGGCAKCPINLGRKFDPAKLPPPISLGEQVDRLEQNMRRIPRLRGEAAINGVTISFVDDKGNRRQEHADGRLLLRQRFGEEARGGHDPADVRLVGMAFDQRVFEAGRNSNEWWFMMLKPLVPESAAWVGDARRPVEFRVGPEGQRGGGPGILRADVVPVLLGVSPWAVRPAPEEAVAMKVDDFEGVNNLMVFGPRNDLGGGLGARTTLRREVMVDRFTGQILEVRLYDQGGVLVMRSILRDYREAVVQAEEENAGNAANGQAKGPLVPYQVTLEYPARQMVIGLVFDRVVVPLRDVAYEAPEAEQGVRVNRVE